MRDSNNLFTQGAVFPYFIDLWKDIEQYIRSLTVALRTHPLVVSGASPRAALALKSLVR
jgi:hypothetical protein